MRTLLGQSPCRGIYRDHEVSVAAGQLKRFCVADLSIVALLETYEVEQSISVPLLTYGPSHIRSFA